MNFKELFTKIILFVSKWSDCFVLFPLAIVLFITNSTWIKFIDPTAQVMSPEFLALLNFNVIIWLAVFLGSYFISQLYFNFDIFKENWQTKIKNPFASAFIAILLWAVNLTATYLILTRNI